ncbi:MAG: integral rane sensor signal transduction histidine kinase [Verrucomicrobiales bacterium]|nr:integral rane sensor signal transduction histidine kinase [Verrucomicrobiales bacterium]
MLPQSIRWRIQAWHGFLLVCVVGALLFAFYGYDRAERLREIDAELQSTLTPLLPAIGGRPPPMGMDRGRDDAQPPPRDSEGRDEPPENSHPRGKINGSPDRLPEGIKSGRLYYIAWTPENIVRISSANAPAEALASFQSEVSATRSLRTRGWFREALHYGPDGGCTAVGISLAPVYQHLHRLAFFLVGAGIVIIALGLSIGWWVAGRALRPLIEITATAQKISGGDLSKRINPSDAESELGQLATVLNGTFDKIERMLEEQLRFTADASHELRTPIAVLLTQIQLSLSRERTPEEYKKTLETCERAAERMRLLVNQLIELARVDAGDASLVWEKCDLGRVARDAIEFIDPLAQKKKVTLQHSIESVRARADVMKLGQVFINLLNNAIHHNGEGVEVCLSVHRSGDKAVVRIADNGVGIPSDALSHLFDRFYRVDKARARGKGNSGLGLAICKAIVEGHGGTIRVESELGKGTEFTIELPAVESRKG